MAVIGIDFGTTTCSVARWEGEKDNKPDILEIDKGSPTSEYIIRSRVAISNGRELHNFKLEADQSGRGEVFLRRRETAREKRRYKFDQMAQCLVPLNNDTEYCLEVKREPVSCKGGGNYLEEELVEGLEVLFSELYQRAVGYTAAEKVVVGLPLGYLEVGRERVVNSLKKAGWVTGSEQIILFPEPLAIALRCGLDYKTEGKQRIMVADHGGGTLDMCIFDLEAKGGDFHIKVLTQKRCDIAGNVFDEYLMQWIGKKEPRLYPGYGVDSAPLIKDYSLWDAVEECKIRLSDYKQTTLKYPSCPFGELEMRVTRKNLETAIKEGLEYIQNEIESLLTEVKNDSVPIKQVFLAGGSARMPCIQELFEKTILTADVIKDYTGSGVLAQSLALVPQYQDFVERLSESTYGIWDYRSKTIVTLVKAGTLVTPKTDLIETPRMRINIEGSGKPAPLIMFHQQGGQWEPLCQIEMETAPVGLIDMVPMLDNASGNMKTVLKANDYEIKTQLLYYADLKDQAPPVVHKGQIARIGNFRTDYFVSSVDDIAQINKELEMAVGQMHPYRLIFDRYKIRATRTERLNNNHDLSILRMGRLSGNDSVDLEDLVEKGSFIPLLDVGGNEFSLILPNENEQVDIEEEPISEDEAAAALESNINAESPLDGVKSALAGLINEEIDRAWEKGRIDMKRELLVRYVVLKTQQKKIEEETIRRFTEAWNDYELDYLIDQAFGLSTPGKILDLLKRKDIS